MKTCIAWYRAEQWAQWRDISADRDEMELSYDDWAAKAEETIESFTKNRVEVHKVPLDIDDFMEWAKSRVGPITGRLRSEFASALFAKISWRPNRDEDLDPGKAKR